MIIFNAPQEAEPSKPRVRRVRSFFLRYQLSPEALVVDAEPRGAPPDHRWRKWVRAPSREGPDRGPATRPGQYVAAGLGQGQMAVIQIRPLTPGGGQSAQLPPNLQGKRRRREGYWSLPERRPPTPLHFMSPPALN